MNNIQISKMTLDDFNKIKDVLISDFDDFWNVNTLEEELYIFVYLLFSNYLY